LNAGKRTERRNPGTPTERIRRLNARIPVALVREESAIAKQLRKPRISPMDGLEALYDLVDRHLSYTSGLVACHKGCAYCCYSEVATSRLEADFIAAKTGLLVAEVADAPMVSESFRDPARPCPFVTTADNTCAIYPYRPMLCRTHISFATTNAPCQFDSTDIGMPNLDRGRSWPGVMRGYLDIVERHGGVWADIRNYFPLKNEGGEIVANFECYSTKQSAKDRAVAVRSNAPITQFIDLT